MASRTSQLLEAARSGDTDAVRELVKPRGWIQEAMDAAFGDTLDINADDGDRTALHWAVVKGDKDMCEALLKAGADADARDVQDSTPLHLAASYGKGDLCKVLVEHGADLNAQDDMNRTPLHHAVLKRQFDQVETLIGAGADPGVAAYNGKKPLDYLDLDEPQEIRKLLVHDRVNGPLFEAVIARDVDACRAALDQGADVNATDTNGRRPLDLAIDQASWAGIDDGPSGYGDPGETPEDEAGREAKNEVNFNKSVDVGLLLIESGAKIRPSDLAKVTDLPYDDPRLCNKMIEHGADVNAAVDGYTALHRAVSNENITRALLTAGADPNACGEDIDERYNKSVSPMAWDFSGGTTPLHEAVEKRSPEVVKILLEHGADMDLPGTNGESARDWASAGGYMPNEQIASLMQEWKAQQAAEQLTADFEADTAQASARYATDEDAFNPNGNGEHLAPASPGTDEPRPRSRMMRL